MKELLLTILKEASTGKVIISGDEWNIGFNSMVLDNNKEIINYDNPSNNSKLIIKDFNKFVELIEEYVKEELSLNRKVPNFSDQKSKIKWIVSYLFVNATTEDFLNPEKFIKRRISFLKDNSFNNPLEIKLSSTFNNSSIIIEREKCPVSMETPYKITMKLKDGNNSEYNLPSIYYGIDNDTCYIYSIMNKKDQKNMNEQEKKFHNKINRLLYKINDGVTDEDLKDVTMSFVFAINIFMSLMQTKGVEKVKIVPYLPIRYLSRDIAANNDELLDKRNDLIQENLTDKLIRTIRRITYHNKDISIELFPYEIDEYMLINIDDRSEQINNLLLEETNRKINNTGRKK